jgi:hypothetical protein
MDLLQTGLDEIVAVVGPTNATSWNTVGADSERLLKVWVAKESDDPAAVEVATQLSDILWELADAAAAEPSSPPSPPQIVIKESPAPPANTPAPTAMPRSVDTISHVQPLSLSIIEPTEKAVVVELEEVEEDESAATTDQIDEADAEVVEDDEADVEDSGSEASSVVEEEAAPQDEEDDEEEVVEPVAEEEEEEGMSVEQITIRGRTYWRDTDTDDLYAVVGEDDVGDKIGQIVNGIARFFPAKK